MNTPFLHLWWGAMAYKSSLSAALAFCLYAIIFAGLYHWILPCILPTIVNYIGRGWAAVVFFLGCLLSGDLTLYASSPIIQVMSKVSNKPRYIQHQLSVFYVGAEAGGGLTSTSTLQFAMRLIAFTAWFLGPLIALVYAFCTRADAGFLVGQAEQSESR
jgi:hypothetical protein